MSRREEYVCTVNRDEDGGILSIELDATDLEGVERHIQVRGLSASRVAGAVHDVLRGGGIKGRAWSSSKPIGLDQVTGAQLELLLSAARPLRRGDRIDSVSEGIAKMSREEAAYWHAKSHHPGGLPALRLLLVDGHR
jgi:hypothetical protein